MKNGTCDHYYLSLSLKVTPLYKSSITMYPSDQGGGGNLSQLKGMASTFGFDMGGGETSFHIPDIVKSQRLGTELIYRKWDSAEFDNSVNLIQYWKIDDTTSINLNPITWIKALFVSDEGPYDHTLKRETAALQKLKSRISVNERKSGLITVGILMEEPTIASDIANAIYPAIVDITIETHSKQAKLNREFIEKQQMETKNALTLAEDSLKEFRERNRSILESPQLQLEMERFMREVEIQTQVYITLQQQYELACIEEVKETPSVVILDVGKPAVGKDNPKRIFIVIFSIFLGGLSSIGYIFMKREIVYAINYLKTM